MLQFKIVQASPSPLSNSSAASSSSGSTGVSDSSGRDAAGNAEDRNRRSAPRPRARRALLGGSNGAGVADTAEDAESSQQAATSEITLVAEPMHLRMTYNERSYGHLLRDNFQVHLQFVFQTLFGRRILAPSRLHLPVVLECFLQVVASALSDLNP